MIETEYGLGKDGYILFLARIVPEKGIHYLIRAYKKLKTDKKLVIAVEVKHRRQSMQNSLRNLQQMTIE